MPSNKSVTNFIEHVGVKGMKWGVRNRPGQGVRKASTESRTSFKKEAKTLTDEQLRSRVSRMQLEKQYVDLSTGGSGKASESRGQKFVKSLLDVPGNIAIRVVTDQAVKVANGKLDPIIKNKFKL